jgi:hypothetical protein
MRWKRVTRETEWTYPQFSSNIDLAADCLVRCILVAFEAHQYGLRIARQGGLHATGSYRTGGRSSRSLRGVYKAEIGTTVLVASMRDDGQTFHDNRTPENAAVRLIDSANL